MSSQDPNNFLRSMQQRGVADAVAMAAFSEKKWVWVADKDEGYLAAYITKENGDEVVVKTNDDKVRDFMACVAFSK